MEKSFLLIKVQDLELLTEIAVLKRVNNFGGWKTLIKRKLMLMTTRSVGVINVRFLILILQMKARTWKLTMRQLKKLWIKRIKRRTNYQASL